MKIVAMSLAAIPALGLAACVTPAAHTPGPEQAVARLEQTVRLDDITVTPLRVIEDSRCPAATQCVWAGQVRIAARVDFHGESPVVELATANSTSVAGGTLELVAVAPPKTVQAIDPSRYAFTLRFTR